MPARAEYLRVIHLELNRISSHLFWLATSALDLGAISMFWYGTRERELINDLFEMSTGQRMHTRYFQIGGVAEDIPLGWAEKLRGFLDIMPGRLDQYGDTLTISGRLDGKVERRPVPAAERSQHFHPVGVLQGAAGFLPAGHPCRAFLGEPYQQHTAPPVAGANRDRAMIGSECHWRNCLGPCVVHGGEHLLPVRPDHLAGAINDHLRRIHLAETEEPSVGSLPVGRALA